MQYELTFDGRYRLGKALKKAGSAAGRGEVLDAIGLAVEGLIRDQFAEGRDPYGSPWEPLKYREGSPLRDTGAHLLGSLSHEVSGEAVQIGFGFKYAHVHHFGATIRPKKAKLLKFTPPGWTHPIFAKEVTVPARPLVPDGAWPRLWKEDAEDAAAVALEEVLNSL